MNTNIKKTRAWVQANKYHGMEKDIATALGLSKETVRTHLRGDRAESKNTTDVLEQAITLIASRRQRLVIPGGAK
jgi:predicted transcriptional regulator